LKSSEIYSEIGNLMDFEISYSKTRRVGPLAVKLLLTVNWWWGKF